MPIQTWKAVEVAIAKRVNGVRVPVSGRGRGDAPDIAHLTYSIEVKHRKDFPAWLTDAFKQAIASRRAGQRPVVILHPKRAKYDDSIVCMKLQDFLEMLGETNERQSDI